MEAQINQTSLQNAAQREKVALFNHFYEKLAFFLIRVVQCMKLGREKNPNKIKNICGKDRKKGLKT